MSESVLAAKIAAIMGEVGAVPKKGRNKDQGYSFVREVDIVEAVRQKFSAQKIAILPTIERFDVQPIESARGNRGMFANVVVSFALVDGDSGESMRISAAGSGTDYPGDKAVYKAMTGAKKYALTMGLLIATGEDPEQHLNEPAGSPSRAQAGGTRPAQTNGPATAKAFSCPVLSPEGWPCVRPTQHPKDSKAHFFKKPDGYDTDSVPAGHDLPSSEAAGTRSGASASGSAPSISETLPLDV